MRIVQMVISEVAHCEIQDVEEQDATVRGADGFGSTGSRSVESFKHKAQGYPSLGFVVIRKRRTRL